MFFSGLKVRITANLFSLVLLTTIWGNLVVMVFWQKSLITREADRVAQVLHIYAGLASQPGPAERPRFSPEQLTEIARSFPETNVAVAYFNGRTVIFSGHQPNQELARTVTAAGRAGRMIARRQGSIWGIISFGRRYLIIAEPLVAGQTANTALGLRVDLGSVYGLLKENLEILVLYLVMNAAIFTVVGLYRFINLVVTPIERMAKVSATYQSAEDGSRFIDEAGSEFGQLSMALNSMLVRIELDRKQLRNTVQSLETANKRLLSTRQKMVRTEKLAAVGRLSAGLAHEIGNPLGIVHGYLELLGAEQLPVNDRKQFAERGLQELKRIDRLIRQLLNFARARPESFASFRLTPLITELLEMMASHRPAVAIQLAPAAGLNDLVYGEQESIRQVLLNCLLNATDSIESARTSNQGFVEITLDNDHLLADSAMVRIRISDNGGGVRAEQIAQLFEPFFSTKKAAQGTGLGLSVSLSIIESHGGEITITNRTSGGATVTISLPVIAAGDSNAAP